MEKTVLVTEAGCYQYWPGIVIERYRSPAATCWLLMRSLGWYEIGMKQDLRESPV